MADQTTPKGSPRQAPDVQPVRAALELIGSMLEDAKAIDGDNPRSWSLIEMAQDLSNDALEVLATHPQDLDAGEFLNIVALLDGARSVAEVMPATAAILNSVVEIADAAAGVVMDEDCGEDIRRQNAQIMEEAMRVARTAKKGSVAAPAGSIATDVQRGADAVAQLLQSIADLNNAVGPDDKQDGGYKAIVALITGSLNRHVGLADISHPQAANQRQGYMRALADILSMFVDQCTQTLEEFDPIKTTAQSFGEVSHG